MGKAQSKDSGAKVADETDHAAVRPTDNSKKQLVEVEEVFVQKILKNYHVNKYWSVL